MKKIKPKCSFLVYVLQYFPSHQHSKKQINIQTVAGFQILAELLSSNDFWHLQGIKLATNNMVWLEKDRSIKIEQHTSCMSIMATKDAWDWFALFQSHCVI